MNLLQQMMSSRNPAQFVMNMLSSVNNPMAQNVLKMANSGDINGIMNFGRNIAKERGLDFDAEFNKFKNSLGM